MNYFAFSSTFSMLVSLLSNLLSFSNSIASILKSISLYYVFALDLTILYSRIDICLI